MLPALAFGAILRGLLLSYSPYAYWGSDSNSYYSFTELLRGAGKMSLYDKRRYVYPLFLFPISFLPGSDLRWLAWIQHGLGLATLVPLAYCVRKTYAHWRWVIVPCTVAVAGIPVLIWYEHELLAETIFFDAVVWSCAGWIAWVGEDRLARKQRLWWLFYAAFSVLVLTKPAGRFFWPGVLLGLAALRAWRFVTWRAWTGLAALGALTATIGQDSQGVWLLYTSAFPLTRLETPLYAGYKAEIRDLVADARSNLREFKIDSDREWKKFLKMPEKHPERPSWQKLGQNLPERDKVYRALALEGMCHRPDLFALIAAQKLMSSANPDDFKAERFAPDYAARKFEHIYQRYAKDEPRRLRMILGLPENEPPPPFERVRAMLAPHPEARASAWLTSYVTEFEKWWPLENDASDRGLDEADTPTGFGWWLMAAIILGFLPRYFPRVGIWMVVVGGYLFGVFLVGGANARFFGAAWPLLAFAAVLPIDLALTILGQVWRRCGTSA